MVSSSGGGFGAALAARIPAKELTTKRRSRALEILGSTGKYMIGVES
jgi:hypothetical protein